MFSTALSESDVYASDIIRGNKQRDRVVFGVVGGMVESAERGGIISTDADYVVQVLLYDLDGRFRYAVTPLCHVMVPQECIQLLKGFGIAWANGM